MPNQSELLTADKYVASEVRAALARRRISGRSLAARVGMSTAAIARRLSGEISFNVEELAVVASELDMQITDFLPHDLALAVSPAPTGDQQQSHTQTVASPQVPASNPIEAGTEEAIAS